jgi:hypothetical protein
MSRDRDHEIVLSGKDMNFSIKLIDESNNIIFSGVLYNPTLTLKRGGKKKLKFTVREITMNPEGQ